MQISSPTTARSFSQANIRIQGKIGPLPLPFSLPGPADACNNYGFACPTKVGQKETVKLTIPVRREYPTWSLSVRFEMTDEFKRKVVCVEFPISIKNP